MMDGWYDTWSYVYHVPKANVILAKRYSGTTRDTQTLAHTFANDLIYALTKKQGMFLSKVVLSSDRSGGKWKANMVSPSGIPEPFYESTNQTPITTSTAVDLQVDDYMFLRPTQSEFVMLQFGDLLAVKDGKLTGIITDSDFVSVAISLLDQAEATDTPGQR